MQAAYVQGDELTTAALAVSILDRFAATRYIKVSQSLAPCSISAYPLNQATCVAVQHSRYLSFLQTCIVVLAQILQLSSDSCTNSMPGFELMMVGAEG